MGIVSAPALLDRSRLARRLGQRIVLTNGCFDLLHPGHRHCIRQARLQGDRLVVAVNDDDSVRRLKGSGRPRQPVEARMAALAALPDVDWVVPFGEATPARLIAELQPDVIVKGGDYRADEVVGYDTVVARGGRVVVVERLAGWSTTALLAEDRNRTPCSP